MTLQLQQHRLDHVTQLQAARILVFFLVLLAFGLNGVNEYAPVAIVRTAAFLITAGFAVLDGTGALPDSLSEQPYLWMLILPTSIAVNVIVGTLLIALGPAHTAFWFWGFNTALLSLAIGSGIINRRRA